MKVFIVICSMIIGMQAEAAPKSKTKKKEVAPVADKTYQVEKNAPQIAIGDADTSKPIIEEEKASPNYWHAEILITDLTFHLPTLTGTTPSFSQNFVGIAASRKMKNNILGANGHLEFGGQWQQFERSTKVGPRGEFAQEINIYQINVFQNFNLLRAFSDSVIVTAGVGVAPLYLTAEQSIYNNSLSELGYQVMGKANFSFPIRQIFSWKPLHLAANAGVLVGTGAIKDQTMSTLSFLLGVDFE